MLEHRDLSAEYQDYVQYLCSAQTSVGHFGHTSCASLSFAALLALSAALQKVYGGIFGRVEYLKSDLTLG